MPEQELSLSEKVGLVILGLPVLLIVLFFGFVTWKHFYVDAPRGSEALNPRAFTEECTSLRDRTYELLDGVRMASAPSSTFSADERREASRLLREVAPESLARDYERWVINHARSDVPLDSVEGQAMSGVMVGYELRIWQAQDCLIGAD